MLAIVILLCFGFPLIAAEFFGPATPSGNETVHLCPTEGITGTRLVTFGFPFTRGSMTPSRLNTVRIVDGDIEVPAWVESLTPWRHLTDPSIDGRFVRVIRVQLLWSLRARYPACDAITLAWGGPERRLTRSTYINAREAWHLVTTGTYAAPDGVFEPDVLPVLSQPYLSNGTLNFQRGIPFEPSIQSTRDDPDVIRRSADGWTERERWQSSWKNFFYTNVGEGENIADSAQVAPKTAITTFTVDPANHVITLPGERTVNHYDDAVRFTGSGTAPTGLSKASRYPVCTCRNDGSPLPLNHLMLGPLPPTIKRFGASTDTDATQMVLNNLNGLPTTYPFYMLARPATAAGFIALGSTKRHEWIKVMRRISENLYAVERGQFGTVAQSWARDTDFAIFYGCRETPLTDAGKGDIKLIEENYEPWLYDRAAAFYQLYYASGFSKVLREAIRASDRYRSLLLKPDDSPSRAGAFRPKCDEYYWPDTQNCTIYSSAENLVYTYWLTGDSTFAPWAASMKDLLAASVPIRWSSDTAYRGRSVTTWTERSAATRIRSLIYDYELNGTGDSRAQLLESINDLLWHQTGAGGTLPEPYFKGPLWHSNIQHEGGCYDASIPACTIASGWMSVLLVKELVRLYGVSESVAISNVIVALAKGFAEHTASKWSGYCAWNAEPLRGMGNCPSMLPYTISRDGLVLTNDPTSEYVHIPDEAALFLWGWFFSGDPSLRSKGEELFRYATGTFSYLTRPDSNQYNLTDFRLFRGGARQFNWWFSNANAALWLRSVSEAITAPNAGEANRPPSTIPRRGGDPEF